MSKYPPGWTEEMLIERVKAEMFGLENPGICKACGNEQSGCEPDAENYVCEACGEEQVSSPHVILGII